MVYDALGRRARRVVETYTLATTSWSTTSTTHYFHHGWSVVEETDSTGTPTADYLNGRALDEPLAAVIVGVNNDAPIYFHQNALGNVELITDEEANLGTGCFGLDRHDFPDTMPLWSVLRNVGTGSFGLDRASFRQ